MIIGIDPDIDKVGFCRIFDGTILELKSLDMCSLISQVPILIDEGYEFAIENVSANNAVFGKYSKAEQYKKVARSKSVGKVQAAHQIIKRWVEYNNGIVIDVPAGVGKQVKKNAKLFNQLSGWTKRSNQDMRDAWAIAKWALIKENK